MKTEFFDVERIRLFEKELSYIKDEKLLEFVGFVLCNILYDNFFYLPSSSTGKYHNSQDNGYQGLVRHTKKCVQIAKDLMNLEQWGFNDEDKDIIISSLILHDGAKYDKEVTFNKDDLLTGYTKATHPFDMSKKIIALLPKWKYRDSQTQTQLTRIAMCIETHSGQWNMDRNGNVVAEKTKTETQKFVHLCDYIASRDYLVFNIDFKFF